MAEPITMFLCGPKKDCKHDYSRWEDIKDADGNVRGGTAVCTKCGASALSESMWDDSFGGAIDRKGASNG